MRVPNQIVGFVASLGMFVLVSLSCQGCTGEAIEVDNPLDFCSSTGMSACRQFLSQNAFVSGFPACIENFLYECKTDRTDCSDPPDYVEKTWLCDSLPEGECYHCPTENICTNSRSNHYASPVPEPTVPDQYPACIDGRKFDCLPIDDDRCCEQGYQIVQIGMCADELEGDQDVLDIEMGDLDDDSDWDLESDSEPEEESEELEINPDDEWEMEGEAF